MFPTTDVDLFVVIPYLCKISKHISTTNRYSLIAFWVHFISGQKQAQSPLHRVLQFFFQSEGLWGTFRESSSGFKCLLCRGEAEDLPIWYMTMADARRLPPSVRPESRGSFKVKHFTLLYCAKYREPIFDFSNLLTFSVLQRNRSAELMPCKMSILLGYWPSNWWNIITTKCDYFTHHSTWLFLCSILWMLLTGFNV